MNKVLAIFCLLTFTLAFSFAQAQDEKERHWSAKGYLKTLHSVIPVGGSDPIIVDNLLHNRINLRWFPSDAISGRFEIRNRLFYGQLVKNVPGFGDALEVDKGIVDLSWSWINEPSLVAHTTIDRAYLQWSKQKLEVKVGRQRINWGINAVWNPNDIFNAFSFFDFDYEERPGTDALKVQYYTGAASSVELAFKAVDSIEAAVAGLLWKFNRKGYDFQILSGVSENDLVIGGGWAGNIKKSGFKGEFSYFPQYRFSRLVQMRDAFTLAVSLDHAFTNSIYFLSSILYNSRGSNSFNLNSLQTFQISAKNLSPFKTTLFIQVAKPLSPLINSGLAIMYSPPNMLFFFNPFITFSVRENFDLDLLTQIFVSEGSFPGQLYFIRGKLSF